MSMGIDRGLKWRLAITALLAMALLVYFVERMSVHHVTSNPRSPAGVRVIPACEGDECGPDLNKDSMNEEFELLRKS